MNTKFTEMLLLTLSGAERTQKYANGLENIESGQNWREAQAMAATLVFILQERGVEGSIEEIIRVISGAFLLGYDAAMCKWAGKVRVGGEDV